MSKEDFCREHGLIDSYYCFAPDRLFARRANVTIDKTRLQAVRFEHFVQAAPPHWPAALICHTTEERAAELIEYATRHRCPVLKLPSWFKKHLTAISILRRPR